MPTWVFPVEILSWLILFVFWSQFRHVHLFALSRAIPINGFVLLILLLVQGWIGSGIGAFTVIWKEPPAELAAWWMWDFAIFWNGFGLSLYFLSLAYLIYIIYAFDCPDDNALARRRAIVGLLAAPSLVAINSPILWDIEQRWYFGVGTAAALGIFYGLVRLLTATGINLSQKVQKLRGGVAPARENYAKRAFNWFVSYRLKGKPVIERQADGLFGFVLATFFAMVGFTLCDYQGWKIVWVWLVPAGVLTVLWWLVRRYSLAHYNAAQAIRTGSQGSLQAEPREYYLLVFAGYFIAAIALAFLGGAVGYGVALALGSPPKILPAPLSFSFVLGAIAVAYGLLRFYAGRWFYPVLIAGAAVFLGITSQRPYAHRIEELETYYASGNRVHLNDYEKLKNVARAQGDQLDNAVVLQAWRKSVTLHHLSKPIAERSKLEMDLETHRPPLIIVTTAGGASVSAIYTHRFLARLEKEMPGFHKHVRIITGASGGMFGASAFRASLRSGSSPTDPKWAAGLEDDFFSPAVQSMAFKDIPMGLVWPGGYSNDRGRRLERSWDKALPPEWQTDFAAMRHEEAEYALPSMIYSPMLVEDGRPLLIKPRSA